MDKQFSSEEVQKIIARALEIDHETRSDSAPQDTTTDRFSEGDIKRIAAEAGIPADAIRKATVEAVTRPAEVVVSGNLIRVEQFVPGHLDDDGLRRLEREVSGIISQEGSGGPLNLPGSTVLGSSSIRYRSGYLKEQIDGHKLQFTIQNQADGVRLEVNDDISNSITGLYGGIVGGGGLGIGLGVGLGVGIGALGSAAFSILFPVVTISGMFVLARKVAAQYRARRREEVQRISTSLLSAIRTELSESST
ncbi:MAG: hypothetical protein ACLFNQ_00960 [Spirochaetaceae bacterium]